MSEVDRGRGKKLSKIEDKIPKIADHFKELCEEGLTSVELDEVIKKNCI